MSSSNKETPLKPVVSFDQFASVDMRAAEVIRAPMAEGTRMPCRVFALDLGHLGTRTSVGQFALVPEEEMIGRKLIVCSNLSPRRLGPYLSEVLVLGVPHPDSPSDQDQATPLYVDSRAKCGDSVF